LEHEVIELQKLSIFIYNTGTGTVGSNKYRTGIVKIPKN
jgi:hypothetical protein